MNYNKLNEELFAMQKEKENPEIRIETPTGRHFLVSHLVWENGKVIIVCAS